MVVNIGYSEILIILGFLIALDNIITQVLKKVFYGKIYADAIACGVGIILTVFVGLAYCSYNSITIQWYFVPALIIGGFLVAYGAIFGYKTLMDTLEYNRKNKEEK